MVNQLTKSFYNTVLAQCFSSCGNYLIVGDVYGTISVFHLSKLINHEQPPIQEDRTPKNVFTIQDQINSLIATKDYLVVGTVGEIHGFGWKNVKNTKKPNSSWSIELPYNRDGFSKADVNSLSFDEENGLLFAGCGDNKLYGIKLETRAIVNTFTGHKNYIHCLTRLDNKLVTGGEDGQVIIWDNRSKQQVSQLEPSKNDKLVRPELGGWIGGVSINDDWLLCGGGPRLGLWHLRTMNLSTVFPLDDKGIHVAEIYQDKILAGGRSPLFHQMSFNGDVIAEIPTTPTTIYSAIHQEEPFQALCLAGSSPKIDVCNNFIYKNLQLSLN